MGGRRGPGPGHQGVPRRKARRPPWTKPGTRTWGEVLEKVPPETLSRWLVAAARSEAAQSLFRRWADRIGRYPPGQPIGKPADWLPPEAPRNASKAAIGDPLWGWLQTQVPDVVHRINVAGRVEEKVLNFPTAKMEETGQAGDGPGDEVHCSLGIRSWGLCGGCAGGDELALGIRFGVSIWLAPLPRSLSTHGGIVRGRARSPETRLCWSRKFTFTG